MAHGGERKAANEPKDIRCHACNERFPTAEAYKAHLPCRRTDRKY